MVMQRVIFLLVLLIVFAPISTQAQEDSELPEGEIVFVSNRDGNSEIYIMNADGSNQRNLTNNPAEDTSPVWSPDGLNIAFMSNRDRRWHIYIIDVQTSETNRLTYGWSASYPMWSNDGRSIYYWQDIGMPLTSNLEVMMINRDGTNNRNITTNQDWDSALIISPDGHQALFYSSRDNRQEATFLMDLATYSVLHVPVPHYATVPRWTPDGRNFIYYATVDSKLDLFWYDMQTNVATNLSNTPENDFFEQWLPGDRILFRSYLSGISELYTMDFDGSNLTPVASGLEIQNTAYLPDGRYLLYRNDNVYIWDADANHIEMLLRPIESIPPYDAQWRPQVMETN